MKCCTYIGVVFLSVLFSCSKDKDGDKENPPLPDEPALSAPVADQQATYATKALFLNLRKTMGTGILIGQQDATWYGIGDGSGWRGDEDRSDMKSVTGSHPAVIGWDLENVIKTKLGWISTDDPYQIRKRVVENFRRGGINTLSWHMHHPVTFGKFDDKTPGGVAAILPGGAKHIHYKTVLQLLAGYFKSLKTDDGQLVPIIFRPFHEHNYTWFWWGDQLCTPDEYKALYRFTVQYLRDEMKVHNVLYAYSPDRLGGNWNSFMERYPGDEFVDLIGIDNYWEFRSEESAATAVKGLSDLVKYADSKNKIAALTETGIDKLPDDAWFTKVLWNKILQDTNASRIAYLLFWRNANTGHFYVPYPGHSAEADFKTVFADPYSLFLNDIRDMYKVSQ